MRSGGIILSHVRLLTPLNSCSLTTVDFRFYLVWFHFYASKVYRRLGYEQSVDYRLRRWGANGHTVDVDVRCVILEDTGSISGYEGPEGEALARTVKAQMEAKGMV